MPRYLTKSRFKLALECPTKLYYTGKATYYDAKMENAFLAALAEGGYQVGELAKCYYPGGTQITETDHQMAVTATNNLLKQENVILYEAAFRYNDLFVRADILVKKGNILNLIEVKAKSFDPSKDSFVNGQGSIRTEWQPYLSDIAFQKYVVEKACPHYTVFANLMLANTGSYATVEGLNQMFPITKTAGGFSVLAKTGNGAATLGERILLERNVDQEVDIIYHRQDGVENFEDRVNNYARHYVSDIMFPPVIGGQCGNCEFRSADGTTGGLRSGFHECWLQAGVTKEQLEKPLLLSLWDFRKKDKFIRTGKYLLEEVRKEDLEPATLKKQNPKPPGLSRTERQWLQVQSATHPEDYIDRSGLKNEMQQWQYPLHFIDFETTAVALPFHTDRRPYEQVAFQFSHHMVQADGSIEHKGQWISEARGIFPNFHFVRALKKELENDTGTIFRYAAHENTILNVIYRQLAESAEPDRESLCNWIRSITRSGNDSAEQWVGPRNMVDLREMVLKYYYSPHTNGSNSIKYVLPAILSSSAFLQEKYSKPIYGEAIPSKNFVNHTWITFDQNGNVVNPYKLLPPVHAEASYESLDSLLTDEAAGIADGGAAMIAYARMQFSEMGEDEKKRITNALFRYCELDTMAMVLIWEAWREWCR